MQEDDELARIHEMAARGDDRIFAASDILDEPLEALVEELAEGLSAGDRAFMAEAAEELQGRLQPKRFAHSVSVARTARRFARLYGVDESQAVRAGLVHDWDKCYHGREVFDRCREMGIELPEGYESMEALFHAPTGAAALARRFPQLEPEVLQAIARHTSGAVDMQPLDIVIYCADMIEPTRTYPSLDELRALVGEASLEELFRSCFAATVAFLVSRHRFLHPDTVAVWNAWVGESPFARRADRKG